MHALMKGAWEMYIGSVTNSMLAFVHLPSSCLMIHELKEEAQFAVQGAHVVLHSLDFGTHLII